MQITWFLRLLFVGYSGTIRILHGRRDHRLVAGTARRQSEFLGGRRGWYIPTAEFDAPRSRVPDEAYGGYGWQGGGGILRSGECLGQDRVRTTEAW